MNYFSWRFSNPTHAAPSPTMDKGRPLPPGVTIEEHRKTCEAEEGQCPFEQYLDDQDELDPVNGGGGDDDKFKGREDTERRLAKLAEKYERDGVTGEVVDEATALYEDMAKGRTPPLRVPASLLDDPAARSLPDWMRSAYVLACAYPNDKEKMQRVLAGFAYVSKAYSPDLDGYFKNMPERGKLVGGGAESDAYYDKDERNVLKNSTLGMGSENVLAQIERLMLCNKLFPETAYEVLGVGLGHSLMDGTTLKYALKQRRVRVKDESLSDEQIGEWLKKKGMAAAGRLPPPLRLQKRRPDMHGHAQPERGEGRKWEHRLP